MGELAEFFMQYCVVLRILCEAMKTQTHEYFILKYQQKEFEQCYH